MKRDLVRLVGTMLLGGAAMLVTLPACSGPAEGSTLDLATPQATATATATAPQALATATATNQPTGTAAVPQTSATATASVAPAPTTSPTGPSDGELLAQGKLLFTKTAAGLGCAYCHGLDGKGKGPAGIFAADIRGKDEGYIRRAIQSGVPIMSFIKLSDDEITAVAAYLQYLATQ